MSRRFTQITAAKAWAIVFVATSVLAGCSQNTEPEVTSDSSAVCEEPRVTMSDTELAVSSSFTLEGEAWENCDDTPNDSEPAPWSELTVQFVQGDEVTRLGTVEPDSGAFEAEFTVPSDAAPGGAQVTVAAPNDAVVQELTVTIAE